MAFQRPSMKRLISAAYQLRSYSAPAERSIPAAKQKYVPSTGTYPKGFLAGSSHAGVKASNTQYDDIAMVVSETPCSAAAVFTRNLFKAAPVKAGQRALYDKENSDFRGVVVNSGCANAVTGTQGLEHANAMARATDACFGDTAESAAGSAKTLVMSTGVIGQKLPIEKIVDAIPKAHAALGSEHANWMSAARAICTTDTFPKLLSRTFTLPSHPNTEYRIAGMAKGAGMIHPNMGTLLGVICTDAKIAPSAMRRILKVTNGASFNSITIDGDTSTNDTVAFFANGAAAPANIDAMQLELQVAGDGNRHVRVSEIRGDTAAFLDVLGDFMKDLAQLVVRDGEGATKFVKVSVKSNMGYSMAKAAATSIATSSLVKTALYGKDANWGRILCAIGYTPALISAPDRLPSAQKLAVKAKLRLAPSRTTVSFKPADGSPLLNLLVRGEPAQVDEERAKEILEMEDLEIVVDMADYEPHPGKETPEVHEAVVYTCDFSHEYVTINGDYRT